MADYSNIYKEETLKAQVFIDFFGKAKFSYEPDTDNIDFIITDAKSHKDSNFKQHYLWAEAKKGVQDIPTMITQLILTIKKTIDKGERLPPPYIGCFDTQRIAFVPFHDILPIFIESDFNWNTAPSNHEAEDFQKAKLKIEKLFLGNLVLFHFASDKKEIIDFINNNLVSGLLTYKNLITKNNFVHVYNKWVKEVKPFINIPEDEWIDLKNNGILDCDFFRADMMSSEGNTITEKLKIILEKDNYKLQENLKGRLFQTKIDFTDDGIAYKQFWNKYERPPAQEYQQYIIDRRDLLVPQNIREVKGSFFTPAIWVEKSQEYLASVFGENWQDEYYIWDCAAGTGNLLAGLVNKYNIWASTLDQPDVDTMHALIDEGFNLLPAHVFQFDFLNDSFDKLPESLRKIINDPEKRKKLIVYINPPYAEATNKKAKGIDRKDGVAKEKSSTIIKNALGAASNELYAHFMARIYLELNYCCLGMFSKLKFLNSQNFKTFRSWFSAEFQDGFVVRANTFDNVKGNFPIGFTIWRLGGGLTFPKKIVLGVIEEGRRKKRFWCNARPIINDWIKKYSAQENHEKIGILNYVGNDFQQNERVWLSIEPSISHIMALNLNPKTILPAAIYFSVRHCIKPEWLNDRDQFYYPDDLYKKDIPFQNNCLIFSLFHGQNRISVKDGVNHWIPFSAQEINSKTTFKSTFMSDFLVKRKLSKEAKNVFEAGKNLWKYYHSEIKNNRTAPVDASFYDIREYFKGRSAKGTMKQKSDNEIYNDLIKKLNKNMSILAEKIQPKVYEYGFLLE